MNRLSRPRTYREDVLKIARRHGARNVRVFGSVARGEEGPESDIDLLVDLEAGRSLFDQMDLIEDLEAALGEKVDVVTERVLHWYQRDRVRQEAVLL